MIVTRKEFCMYVEEEFINNELNMVDTVIEACTTFNVDPIMIEPLVNRSIKEKLEMDFINLNYIKAQNHEVI